MPHRIGFKIKGFGLAKKIYGELLDEQLSIDFLCLEKKSSNVHAAPLMSMPQGLGFRV